MRIQLKRPSPAMAVALLALGVALSGTTYAATGGSFILGHQNTATSSTKLTAKVRNKVLQVKNSSAKSGAAGIGITVAPGHAPIKVNPGAGKARYLNADKLDGIDSKGFLALGAPAGRLVAEGRVQSDGSLLAAAGAGVTSSRSAVGNYNVTVPGLNPGCAHSSDNILATPFGAAEVSLGVITTQCGPGDATFSLQTRNSAGTAVDGNFFFAIFKGAPVTKSPESRNAKRNPSVCVVTPAGEACH